MKKIIFISGTPLSSTYGQKIDPEWYEKDGIKIEFWNLDRLYFKEENINSYFKLGHNYKFKIPSEKIFYNKKEVIESLRKINKGTLFCSLDFGNHDDYWLRRKFKCLNIDYFVGPRNIGYFSKKYTIKTFAEKFFFILKSIYESIYDYTFLRRIAIGRRFKKFIYDNTSYYKRPLFVASSGSVARNMWMSITKAHYFVSIKSIDTIWVKSKRIIKDEYAVFVDDTIFYAPDVALNNWKKNILSLDDLKKYTFNLNKIFETIEKKLQIKIIIAASGKFSYGDKNPYGNRSIIYGRTNELLQYSKLAIGHNSSGLNQAYIEYQPIIMLIDDFFSEKKQRRIKLVADFYGIKPINTKEFNENMLNSIPVNRKFIDKQISGYFCEDIIKNDFKDSKEIIFEEIKKI